MIGKFLTGAIVMAGAIVTATVISEIQKNEGMKSAGKDLVNGARNFGKEVCKSAANVTKTSVASVKEKIYEAKAEYEADAADNIDNEILSSDNGDIAVCAEGIKDADNIPQDKFVDADTELSDDEIIENTEDAEAEC